MNFRSYEGPTFSGKDQTTTARERNEDETVRGDKRRAGRNRKFKFREAHVRARARASPTVFSCAFLFARFRERRARESVEKVAVPRLRAVRRI